MIKRYRFAIADFLISKGLDTSYKVMKAMGKDSAQARRLLDPNRTQINIDVINDICEHFPDCTPANFIVAVQEKPKTPNKKTAKKR